MKTDGSTFFKDFIKSIAFSIFLLEAYAPIPCILKESSKKISVKRIFSQSFIGTTIIYLLIGTSGYLTSAIMPNYIGLLDNLENDCIKGLIQASPIRVFYYLLYIVYLSSAVILYLHPAWIFLMQLMHGKNFAEEQEKNWFELVCLLALSIYCAVFTVMPNRFLCFLSSIAFLFILIVCILCQMYIKSSLVERITIISCCLTLAPLSIYASDILMINGN